MYKVKSTDSHVYCYITLHKDCEVLVLVNAFVPLSANEGYGVL